jgi:hypothetical protein
MSAFVNNWDFESALEAYSQNVENEEYKLGHYRYLQVLSMYIQLAEESLNYPKIQMIARWHFLDLERFQQAAALVDPTDTDIQFYHLLYQVIQGDLDKSPKSIDEIYQIACDSIFLVISKDSGSSYREFSRAALFSVIEELIEYKKLQHKLQIADVFERPGLESQQRSFAEFWKLRFDNVPNDPGILFEHLCIYSLVRSSDDLDEQWGSFSTLLSTVIQRTSLKQHWTLSRCQRASASSSTPVWIGATGIGVV